MTIKISGDKGLGPLDGLKKTQKAQADTMEKVAFSPLILEMSHLQDGGSSEVSARQQKIAALKAQIAEGSYQPDLKQVAASLLKFVAGEK